MDNGGAAFTKMNYGVCRIQKMHTGVIGMHGNAQRCEQLKEKCASVCAAYTEMHKGVC
jgi:hypothetical protein